MDERDCLKLLEDKFLTYKELVAIPVRDNGEPLLDLTKVSGLCARAIDERMKQYTGAGVFVREAVAAKLLDAQKCLEHILPKHKLEVVYGYRHRDIQNTLYDETKQRLLKEGTYANEDDLNEDIHRFIAVPSVAGHPSGGAVDLQIIKPDATPLDMGTAIHAFVRDEYVFSPFISKAAWHNRQLLRLVMMASGFAPYDGEWWHFSYGDREWACFYGKEHAVYEQLSFSVTK